MKPTDNSVPKHIGFIMDGNRRFAKRLMAKPWKGHEWGAKKLEKVLKWCQELEVKEITIYAFSIQNFNRPKEEFDYIMKVLNNALEKILNDENFMDRTQGLRINFIGRIQLFPKEIVKKIKQVMKLTKDNKNYILNLAFGYGGREEVLDAVKKIGKRIKQGTLDIDELNEEVFSNELYIDSEPDMIIRTGGEHRTSNFLIWQSGYSEWFFVEKMWPEFEKEDFLECVQEYSKRHRRFGR